MSIEFTVNKDDNVILITITNTVSVEDLKWMRSKTIELLNETGLKIMWSIYPLPLRY